MYKYWTFKRMYIKWDNRDTKECINSGHSKNVYKYGTTETKKKCINMEQRKLNTTYKYWTLKRM